MIVLFPFKKASGNTPFFEGNPMTIILDNPEVLTGLITVSIYINIHMTTPNIKKRPAAKKSRRTSRTPSTFQRFSMWRHSFIPYMLGVIMGSFTMQLIAFVRQPQPTPVYQAAQGGAAIPFPSGSPSPMLSAWPPGNSKAESTASSLTKTSELPLPGNLQADNGQTKSTRLFRPLIRRTQ